MSQYSCFMETQTQLPKTKRGQKRRRDLLRAAEDVFSEKGFMSASIADITRQAGAAQGTFYIYFESKEQLFREVMLELGRQIRSNAREATRDAKNRIDAEVSGLEAYLRFVTERPSIYRIVQQCSVVDPDAWRDFYSAFADAFETNLKDAEKRGEVSPGDAEVRAWVMIALATTLGEQVSVGGKAGEIDRMMREVEAILRRGISPVS
jgi:AcrR family transcriptional regulator